MLIAAIVLVLLSSRLLGQTGREYYDELKKANGLNPLATLVCFPEEEKASFAILGLSWQFADTLRSKGLPVPKEFQNLDRSNAEKYLWWQGFQKGIPAAPWLLDQFGSPPHWALKFDELGDQKLKGEIHLAVNWSTLRYKLEIKVGHTSAPFYGRCEPIR